MRYIWDIKKNDSNLKKHGISFYDASQVFRDENYITLLDSDHSLGEYHFVVIGMTQKGLLTVVYVERIENVVRIITARKAKKAERGLYENKIRS